MSSNNATTWEVNKKYFLSGKHAKDLDIVVFNNEYVPPLANIYECPIILPAIQDNRIANYKSKNFRSQPLRDLALGYALGHGLFYCNIGCPVILSFLTLQFNIKKLQTCMCDALSGASCRWILLFVADIKAGSLVDVSRRRDVVMSL